ncbi:MAG: S1 RNA-binding domain-containing protein [Clostridiales bacterium]|nr:S1 RNA-binding domain-containing protein [Clostridiales bacterium]
MELGIGTVLEGKVTGITKYGAFVSLPEGKSGMVHISEIAHAYVSDIRQHLTEGQLVKVKVIGIDESGRINLSIKKTSVPPPPQPVAAAVKQPASDADSFEERLNKFLQESKSILSSSKLYSEKRPRRRAR